MNKNLIVKIVILIIILVGAQGVFWFFKTSAAKKHITAIVNSSDGNVSVSKVSVSGFPLSQKISIDDVKFQADTVAEKIYLPNKYQVNIKHLEISGSVFGNDFKARIIGQVSVQDANGNAGYVEFKQEPSINFTSVKDKIQKLSYLDAGYKIVDEAKNILYEGGNSVVEFTSSDTGGGKVLNNVKADFNDLVGVDIFTTEKIVSLINPTAAVANDPSLKPANIVAPAAVVPEAVPANPAVPSVPTPAPVDNFTKKAIHLEIEYVMAPKNGESADKAPAALGNLELASVSFKKLEFVSPLYKIDINGNFTSAPPSSNSAIASCDVIIQVEKIENILTYIKTALASSAKSPTPAPVTAAPAIASPPATPLAPQNTATGSETDIATAIMDLAKKNVNSKDSLAVFEIKKEKDNDFMVNGTPLIDLAKIFPAFAGDIANENY